MLMLSSVFAPLALLRVGLIPQKRVSGSLVGNCVTVEYVSNHRFVLRFIMRNSSLKALRYDTC